MEKLFTLPDLGEGLHEAEIAELLIKKGDQVVEGDLMMVVETDKASVEIPSPFTGMVMNILVNPGDLVNVGDTLIAFDVLGEGTTEEKPVEKTSEPRPDVETSHTQTETTQPHPSFLPVAAAPSTRRLARELGIEITAISGSGSGGRVTDQDVRLASQIDIPQHKSQKQAVEKTDQHMIPAAASIPSLLSDEDLILPDFSIWGKIERVPLRSIRRAVAKRMALSWSQIPHVSHHDDADITELETLRKKLKNEVPNLTLTVFFIKAVVAALKEHPRFNASLDPNSVEIILKSYYNIGVAVDTERGLIVPVIHEADRKSITEIAVELNDLVHRTRGDQNKLEDIQGGTFTITNAGVLGGTHFSPIINYPQVAILGSARAKWQPVVRKEENGRMEIVPRFMLPLILTFDHRVLDGGDGARFMNLIIQVLEDPEKLLLKI